MNRNQKLLNDTTHFWLQVDEINEAVRKAIRKRLIRVNSDLSTSIVSSQGQLTTRNIPNLVAGSLFILLQDVMRDVNETIFTLLLRASRAYPRFINNAVSTEALDLSLLDPFGLTDLGEDNNAFTIFADILGITEDEARELFAELLLFGLGISEVWAIWLLRQRELMRQRLAQVLSQVDPDTLGSSSNILRDVQNTLRDTLISDSSTSVQFTLESLSTSLLFKAIERMIKQTVDNNQNTFTGEYLWVAILDSSVCKRCASLHNRRFRFGEGPIPQIHPWCRCFIMPLLRDGGAVSVGSFQDWLKDQPMGTQDSILGKKGADLFRAGDVQFKDFIQFRNNVVPRERSINEIERLAQ